jgi:hypothetical protein
MKKDSRGGKRQNAGRLPKYNEPTKTIAFRVPISKHAEIKKLVKDYLVGIEAKKLLINILDTENAPTIK